MKQPLGKVFLVEGLETILCRDVTENADCPLEDALAVWFPDCRLTSHCLVDISRKQLCRKILSTGIQETFERILQGDAKVGVRIVMNALDAPIRQIANNGGIDGSVVADIVSGKPANHGYNAFTGEYGDMLKAGVIDPVKVVRTALANAASIAGLLLTTDAMVSTFDEEDKHRHVEGAVK